MKYIRTKDGRIIDVSNMQEFEADDDKGNRVFDSYEDSNGNYYPVENILKQADTIEELCDEFVSIFKDNDKFVETDFQMAQDRFTGLKGIRKPTACYGAIWTDKGLIFVAKMNKKGELELL